MPASPKTADADRLGRAVLRERLGLRPKERVTIECYPSSLPWAAGFVREARRAGAYPIVHYEDEAAYWDAAEHGQADLLGGLPAHEKAALEETDVYVFFWGPEDIARRQRLEGKAQSALFAYNPQWYKVAAKADVRGARMAIARATPQNAALYGLPLDRWRAGLMAASLQDPRSFLPTVKKLERPLAGHGEVRITHPNGTDLTLALADRPVQKATGALPPAKLRRQFGIMVNVPDGSVYVSVDEKTADGTLVANRRTTNSGPILEGGRFTFRNGRLADYRFSKGGSEFARIYRAATGDKARPSFFEVGIVPGMSGMPFLEENELGTVTVGVGGNSAFGGKNDSSLFQYLTVADANVTVGGRPVVRGGRVV
ncbi:MAG TPA: aminopeptidase [Thermoplasmata archaeon]|nr:aminopeptidase [Thermoplasmata archaeon]